jgi:hypothetical protein
MCYGDTSPLSQSAPRCPGQELKGADVEQIRALFGLIEGRG